MILFKPSSTNYGLVELGSTVTQESTLTVQELLKKVDAWNCICMRVMMCVTGDSSLSSTSE